MFYNGEYPNLYPKEIKIANAQDSKKNAQDNKENAILEFCKNQNH